MLGKGRNVVGSSPGSVSVLLLQLRVRGSGVSSCSGLLQESTGAAQELEPGTGSPALTAPPRMLPLLRGFLGFTGCLARVG